MCSEEKATEDEEEETEGDAAGFGEASPCEEDRAGLFATTVVEAAELVLEGLADEERDERDRGMGGE
jgi:hypothetical protein